MSRLPFPLPSLRRAARLGAIGTVAVGAAAGLVLAAGPAQAAPPASTDGKTYVALGDSYAAGLGLPATDATPTGQPVPGCAQTDGDYPHLLAAKLGLTLTDVTCSGARTTDFSSPQSVTGGEAPPQLDVFKTVQPDLVSITIGGNDLGFAAISGNCLAATAAGPPLSHLRFPDCKTWYTTPAAQGGGAAANPYDRLDAVIAKVDAAIGAVRAAAPNAKVVVIAYPAIAPDTANTPGGSCYTANALVPPVTLPGLPVSVGSAFPFTDVDVPWLQVLQERLNQGIGEVAEKRGATYADIYPSSLSHSACQPESTRWVEPIIVGNPGGTNVLHPNLRGTTAMADLLASVVPGLFPAATTPPASPTASPTVTRSGGTGGTGGSVVPTVAGAGSVPLADTGTRAPVGPLLGIAGLCLAAGGAALALGRRGRRVH